MAVLFLILGAFTTFHFVLCIKGRTTLEFFTEESNNERRHAYNYGIFKNWVSVFNWNPIYWFIPVNANLNGKGIFFDNRLIK